jgi:hypothetical protein
MEPELNQEIAFVEPNRDVDTLFERCVGNREEALALFRQIARDRKVVWAECASVQEFLRIEPHLKTLPENADVFLYLSMPPHYLSWDLVTNSISTALDAVLFRLWPVELKLYLVHAGKPMLD